MKRKQSLYYKRLWLIHSIISNILFFFFCETFLIKLLSAYENPIFQCDPHYIYIYWLAKHKNTTEVQKGHVWFAVESFALELFKCALWILFCPASLLLVRFSGSVRQQSHHPLLHESHLLTHMELPLYPSDTNAVPFVSHDTVCQEVSCHV